MNHHKKHSQPNPGQLAIELSGGQVTYNPLLRLTVEKTISCRIYPESARDAMWLEIDWTVIPHERAILCLTEHLISLACTVAGLGKASIRRQEGIVPVSDDFGIPTISLFINQSDWNGNPRSVDYSRTVRHLVSAIFGNISKVEASDEVRMELDHSSPEGQLVAQLQSEFRSVFGGRVLHTPFNIECHGLSVFCSGRIRELRSLEPRKPSDLQVAGRLVLLDAEQKSFTIKPRTGQNITFSYDTEVVPWRELRGAVGESTYFRFKLLESVIGDRLVISYKHHEAIAEPGQTDMFT